MRKRRKLATSIDITFIRSSLFHQSILVIEESKT